MHDELNYIINHVFLPPKLPQKDDSDNLMNVALIEKVINALKSFKDHVPEQEGPGWNSCIKMANHMIELRNHSGELVAGKVEIALKQMVNGDVLTFHIESQNAGLIIRRSFDQYSFESFELSPTNDAVMGTIGRLRRCFPGPAIVISQDRIADINFLESLADLLMKLDVVTPAEVIRIVVKAQSKVAEIRDTPNPRFVTEMLTGILRAIGQPASVPRIYKHTREEVLWKNARKPWRRSPLWLLLRVVLQTSLLGKHDEKSHLAYKSFMLFFMTSVLEDALEASLPSDKLFMMTAKISRRALKLGTLDGNVWLGYVEKIIEAAQQELIQRWELVENNPDPLMTQRDWNAMQLSFLHDTRLTLPKLRPYLIKLQARSTMASNSHNFRSDCGRRILQCTSELPDWRLLVEASRDQVTLNLVDLEMWVRESLDEWLSTNLKCENTSTALTKLIDSYTSTASSAYADMPEDISLMLLTLMDLWIALDKCALHHCPLLRSYDPGFPLSLFEPLLLPQKSQMKRLMHVERYLDMRRRQAKPTYPSIFQCVDSADSFLVQYFQQSTHHQNLRRSIEAKATIERSQKKSELAEKRQQYKSWMEESKSMSCEDYSFWKKGRKITTHSYSCQKCQLIANAKSLSIDVHEWPLPGRDLEAKAVVVELDIPNVIHEWLDTTYGLLIDTFSVVRDGRESGLKVYTLHTYAGLSEFVKSPKGRVQLASTAKPFVVSHYRSKEVSQATKETDVCVNNGLFYSMYDSERLKWTKELLGRCGMGEKCTLKLPEGPYKGLQFALSNTIHTSNEVIARQDKCPETLTLHEFYAFGTLRSGHRLQWRNIIRELAIHVLNFSCQETYNLFAQAAWQAGPFKEGKICRDSHTDLEEEKFGRSLLSTLDDAIGAVEDNWQGAAAVRTFIVLASRLLSLSTCDTVREDCARFMRRARAISLCWTRELGQKLDHEQREKERKDLSAQILEMALTCYGTFDVELEHLHSLFQSDEDIAIATECSTTVHDRCPAVTDNVPIPIKALLQRHSRTSCSLESTLRNRVLGGCIGLDDTIGLLWKGYKSGSPWKALGAPSERWLVKETSSEGGVSSVQVHYNILDGRLLFNGSPLSRLPQPYEVHSTFRRLFGEKILDVVPSNEPGMVFQARNTLFDHQVHFNMHGSELIIRARKGKKTYELLPVHTLDGDFPHAFVQDFAHWLDVDTDSVEWRPLTEPWTQSTNQWQMRSSTQGEYSLIQGSLRLIDPHSPTANAVSKMLSPLEYPINIETTFNYETQLLEVHLPRLKLNFFLRKGATQLESKQFRGMIIDVDQSFGTLTGLVNKLVLRGQNNSVRTVIIPHGDVSFRQEGSHTRVHIKRSVQHLSYDLYQIDHQLGRLVDNGSLRSKLFKCYLHAVTAHCVTDKLTGRTGTEEALYILASPSVRSFPRLDQTEADTLLLLARLTPRREYYPQHLKVMQTVEWEKLSPLAQHDSFSDSVKSIFEQVDMYSLFGENSPKLPSAGIRECKDLLERATIRNSTYRVHGFGAENQTTTCDVTYNARDNTPDSLQESQVFHTATLVDRWSVELKCCSELLYEIQMWGQRLLGCREEDEHPLGYDTKWLEPIAKFLPAEWCSLQKNLSHSVVEKDKYKIMMFLSTLSYSKHANQELVQTLLAFATVPQLRGMNPPDYVSFQLSDGFIPDRNQLLDVTRGSARDFHLCPEYNLPQLPHETPSEATQRRGDEHEQAVEEHLGKFVDALIHQWPTANVNDPTDGALSTYISIRQATDKARNWFDSWFRNAQFRKYTDRIKLVLYGLDTGDQSIARFAFYQPQYLYCSGRSYITLGDLMGRSAPALPPAPEENFGSWVCQQSTDQVDHSKLDSLLQRLSEPLGGYEKRYAVDLVKSSDSLRSYSSTDSKLSYSSKALQPILEEHLQLCKNHLDDIYRLLCHCLQAEQSITRHLAFRSRMCPRLSSISLLQQLARDQIKHLPSDWKACLIKYGQAISALQRAERLLMCTGSGPDLLNEIRNRGHQNWDPAQYPDWLLLEIENSISIRPAQVQIAREMISPSSGKNSIMQLNMGEGKSSVIVPIVAATLANEKILVRVVVLKPLSPQMFHVLVGKLSGMLGRRIYHMPVSRSVRLNEQKAKQIRNLCEECMNTGGILLVQPEHILSFELMGFEQILSDNSGLGRILTETQHWLKSNSRDILDESDEILSVRFELIYTMGMQRTVELGPDRWIIIERVLGIVSSFADTVLKNFPHGLEREPACTGCFPRLRILQSSAGDQLLEMVARKICKEGLPGVPVWNLLEQVRDALFRFVTDLNISEADLELLNHHVFDVESMKKSLLLLRGLIACGVLMFALQQKRWRVNYGLDLSRTMLAVPYRAKDIPATRAEFSHPDTTIVLTCLSYYYGGLSDEQLYVVFEKLLLCDRAQEEYEQWVQDAPKLPSGCRRLTGINLRDHVQCSQTVFPSLRLAKSVIDFYLSTIVFPKEMKEFPHKLSSSGWDIAREKVHPTTGFSGTNDSRYILPLSISQCDLPEQQHTNALVLDYLLRPENSFKQAIDGTGSGSLNAESLLQIVVHSEPPVRVILDVGAQVLEWTNEKVAQEWLSNLPASKAQAVIFFSDDNNLTVLDRDGNTEPLMMSPFAKQMDQCLVYLDEAHTRGTDLKLPIDYRAAVTLGPDLTKDRLVQACMRMRKLGKGQSVLFCCSKEVERKILSCNGKASGDPIEVADVLQWSISETCINTKKSVPLWAIQGLRHQRRLVATSQSSKGDGQSDPVDAAKSLLETEAQSLEVRYGIGGQGTEEQILLQGIYEGSLLGREAQIQAIREKCQEFELKSFNNATLREEQERELSPENEQERQVERPPALKPYSHSVHKDVKHFIHNGVLDRHSDAFQPAFELFKRTSAVEFFEKGKWPSHLLVTTDFSRTVQTSSDQFLDSYLRPVNWIATRKGGNMVDCLILSPYEAHELLPFIRQGSAVTLHIYSPQVSMSARLLEDLTFCAIPAMPKNWTRPPFVMQLNLFAGQPYLSSYDEYLSLCRFLGLSSRPPSGEVKVASDGFVRLTDRKKIDAQMVHECPFTVSPVGFLRMLMALRRKGQSFERSHLGKILSGDLLTEDNFRASYGQI